MPDPLLDALDRILEDVIRPQVARVDAEAAFPRAAVDALAAAGLLGLLSAPEVGGQGRDHRVAFEVIERIARVCPSTAMVTCMHLCGAAVIEKHGSDELRIQVAAGRHLSTLAFSEAGSRSQFWAPTSSARRDGDLVALDARKSWVTSASHATAYVWSSRPLAADGASTLWLVPADAPGLSIAGSFDGMGLRGNDSAPVTADGVRIPLGNRLGPDGGGFDVMMGVVLPLFNLLTAACGLGIMEAATLATGAHAGGTRFEHTGSAIADLPTARAYIARMRVKTDMVRTLLVDTGEALATGREDAMLRVLESKAAAGEAATEVTELAMRVCGGAAFRKEVGVERMFRDARAGTVMAPTTDALYDFIGKAACGLPLFG